METNHLTQIIIGKAIDVHKELGSGLLESAYQECLFYELNKANLFVEKERLMPLIYHEVRMECVYRIDLFVETKLLLNSKRSIS